LDKNFFLGESTKELRVFIILRGIKFIQTANTEVREGEEKGKRKTMT
jgi:hypothetical protein